MKTKQPTLPDEPSDLIRVSIRDMIEVKKDPKYIIDMGVYHEPSSELGIDHEPLVRVCRVCLAGSVIAKTFNFSKYRVSGPVHFDYLTKRKLQALDQFRQGNIWSAFEFLNLRMPNGLPSNYFDWEDDYNQTDTVHDDFDLFCNTMLDMADMLEVFGH